MSPALTIVAVVLITVAVFVRAHLDGQAAARASAVRPFAVTPSTAPSTATSTGGVS